MSAASLKRQEPRDALPLVSLAVDPIEKKPLARFHPGSHILSIGSYGCTMHCPWCQNHEIALPEDVESLSLHFITPVQLADLAVRLAGGEAPSEAC